jgi:elongation factor P
VKVNANTLRAGQAVEHNGSLFVVLRAENIQPGKGTPVTQVELRRVSDGIKVTERFRTTETVERAFIDEREYQYLYQEGDNYALMDIESYDQITVSPEVIGEQAKFLQEGMHLSVRLHEGKAISVALPPRVTLEVVETEPTMKGQTAAGSYKPALLSNGVRAMVPPHIVTGTRIVVSTEDGSYLERAKD